MIILTIFVLEATRNCSVLTFKCTQIIRCERQLLLSADNFANSRNQDQNQQNIGSDLDPNLLTLIVFLKECFKKTQQTLQKHDKK